MEENKSENTSVTQSSNDCPVDFFPSATLRPHFSISSILGLDRPVKEDLGNRRSATDFTSGKKSDDNECENYDRKSNMRIQSDEDFGEALDEHDEREYDEVLRKERENPDLDDNDHDDDDLDESDEVLLSDAPDFHSGQVAMSAFVRPTPLRGTESHDSIADARSEPSSFSNLLSPEDGAFNPNLKGPMASTPLASLWYPPWMAAFKPVFGLQGKNATYNNCIDVKDRRRNGHHC